MGLQAPGTQTSEAARYEQKKTAIRVFERLGANDIKPYDCSDVVLEDGHAVFEIAVIEGNKRHALDQSFAGQRVGRVELTEPCNDYYPENSPTMPKCIVTKVRIPLTQLQDDELQAVELISKERQTAVQAKPELSPLLEVGLGDRYSFLPSFKIEGDEVVYNWNERDGNETGIRASFQKLRNMGAKVMVNRNNDPFTVEVRMPLSVIQDAMAVVNAINEHHERVARTSAEFEAMRATAKPTQEFVTGC